MKKMTLMKMLVLTPILLYSVSTFDFAEAATTGSFNFCSVFPQFAECNGWRTEAISDSYNRWFCDYVDLEKLCEHKPDAEKQIIVRDQSFCCRFIGDELEIPDAEIKQASQIGKDSPDSSILPLIIWTDKDHYNFRDKVTVYGKFDFTKVTIKKGVSENEFEQTGRIVSGNSIQEGKIISESPIRDIDIKLNGRQVLRDIPVQENGWFVSFFHLNDRYHFSNQNNLLSVDYLQYDSVPLGGPRTHATYHFTTGDIAKENNDFGMWIDDSDTANGIIYGITTENPEQFIELTRLNLVNTRLTTPEGYTVPVKSFFSVQDLSREYDGFLKYGEGTYEIQVTYGDNTSKKTFEYYE
jgi:hypothetical protein